MSKWQRALYQPNIPLGENDERVTGSRAHRSLSKTAAKEGMVLLKNDGDLLPLKKGKRVALFGKGTFDYVKGGGGSGDVTVKHVTNFYDGMRALEGQVALFEGLSAFYRDFVSESYLAGAVPGLIAEPQVPAQLVSKARAFTDTAIITISRFSGENWDRRSGVSVTTANLTEQELFLTRNSEQIFEEGDFYLSRGEKTLVETVRTHFPKIIVVLNVGGMVDTDWFAEDHRIQSVLVAWQGGLEGGAAAAELLCGIGNPSGKLADTFAKKLEDYPSTQTFHESDSYVDYSEDVYVGYRYFESIPGAQKKVNFPFGFGLSYTTFQWSVSLATEHEGVFRVLVNVTNTGSTEGKEVVQLYVQAPQGRLGKASRSLVAFRKTRLLKQGECQLLGLEFTIDNLASYDDLGKVKKSAYILEKGKYHFFLGNSVRCTTEVDLHYELPDDRVVKQLSEKLPPTALKSRMLADGTMERLPPREGNDPDASGIRKIPLVETDGYAPATRSRESYHFWNQIFKPGIRSLVEVAEGKLSLEDFLAQMTDAELAHLLGGQPNTGVANTFGYGNMPEYGIPNIMTADGPAGLRVNAPCGVYATAWPCATLLACTWNEGILSSVGEAGAKEVKENNLAVWLTPAVNIHRSPLCGRNFEYYSEDPLLAGKMGAAIVRGIQSQNVAATVKHFALNNKETNRKNSDSRVSERAAREIYLRAFEIIVAEANPWVIMSSYNIINGHRASENKELLEDILRGEWGWTGLVTSDWWTCGEHYKEVKAGNDVKMASGFPERLLEAESLGLLSRKEMENSAKRVLELILKVD